MLSLQEISDRLEIQELLADYSHAIDHQEWTRSTTCSRPTP